ncbi:MAG: MmcB family DNA repair protein [Rhodospirillaceae bacterium]|nr:MmcB family DNA repair protein [Rhodospirillaceae bacterium]MCY4066131.1 MmcB family DNA repair protein [Rhodospirillaceae bacterium]
MHASQPGSQPTRAERMARGVCRFLAARGFSTLTEFPVPSTRLRAGGQGRRVDVIGLNRERRFVIVEIKTTPADFRSDAKWPDYLPWCDAYYFAVPEGFPADILPPDQGLLVADAFDAAELRAAPDRPMNPTRRRTQILKFALTAGRRLQQALDPAPADRWGGG